MTDELEGRVAFVTGAARGIGLEIGKALADQAARVALVDVDRSALNEAVGQLGRNVLPIQADVSRPDEVKQAVEQTVAQLGRLDILVNNAGICPMTPFAEIKHEEWDRVLGINLKGAFLCSQAALPALRQSGTQGRIINISSVAGQMGGVSVGAHYAASKAGLIAMSKSLAQLLAPDGVTVNCLAPGTTATDMTSSWSQSDLERSKAKIPLGRLARPDEIAQSVCFLASDRAAFITGATLDINGGLYLR